MKSDYLLRRINHKLSYDENTGGGMKEETAAGGTG